MLAALGATACATSVRPFPSEQLLSALEKERGAIEELRATNLATADAAKLRLKVEEVLAAPAFDELSSEDRLFANWLDARLLCQLKEYDAARKPLEAVLEAGTPGAPELELQLDVEIGLDDFSGAVTTAIHLFRAWPDEAAGFPDWEIRWLFAAAKSSTELDELELTAVLYAAHWKPQDDFYSVDSHWLSLVLTRLASGDTAGAMEIAKTLRDPSTFIAMRSDRRFDPLIASDPARFDVLRGYGIELAELKGRAASQPTSLEAVTLVAQLLMVVNRPAEALALLDDALARLSANPASFSDTEEWKLWAMDWRAEALTALHREEEAIEVLRAAADESRRLGKDPVSQGLNLADKLNDAGRHKEALAALADVDKTRCNDYGRGVYEAQLARASLALGDTAAFREALAQLAERSKRFPLTYVRTLLQAGMLDEAAATTIASLRDPRRRLEVLIWFQDYLDSYGEHPQGTATRAALRARPDVASELEKFGHINKYLVHNL